MRNLFFPLIIFILFVTSCSAPEGYYQTLKPGNTYSQSIEIDQPVQGQSYTFQIQTYVDHAKVNLVAEYDGNYLVNRVLDKEGNIHLFIVAKDSTTPIKVYAHYWGTDSTIVNQPECFVGFDASPLVLQSHVLDQWQHTHIKDSLKADFKQLWMDPEHFIDDKLLKPYNLPKQRLIDFIKSFRYPSMLMKEMKLIADLRTYYFVKQINDHKEHPLNVSAKKTIIDSYWDLRFTGLDSLDVKLKVSKLNKDYTSEVIYEFNEQELKKIDWDHVDLNHGFYSFEFSNDNHSIAVPIIRNKAQKSKHVIVAPITTWQAYNTQNGQSFYRSETGDNVYQLEMNRPLHSVYLDSTKNKADFHALLNVYQWFNQRGGATMIADYEMEDFECYPLIHENIILAQHCEYISPKSYQNLKKWSQNMNIISLGGNQIYWKVMYTENYDTVYCRKDGTFFTGTDIPGGKWRNNFTSEAHFLGNAFTEAGMHTYAPYGKENTDHPLWVGHDSKKTTFGQNGINHYGASGVETDKMIQGTPENTVLLAKGKNGAGGGAEIVYIDRGDVGTLSFGSISAGASLGHDSEIDLLLENFLTRH